jgi:hypothetical protein
MAARVRNVEDVLSSFELLAQALPEHLAILLGKLDTLEVDELRLAKLLGEKTTDAEIDLCMAARGRARASDHEKEQPEGSIENAFHLRFQR